MKILTFFFLLSSLMPSKSQYLNSNEEAMLLQFIEHRGIKKIIFVESKVSTAAIYSNFKTFSRANIFSTLKTEKELFYYVADTKPQYENPYTLIIYKLEDLKLLNEFFQYLREEEKLRFVSIFTWSLFTNESGYDSNFFIPYDCDFFVFQPLGPTGYKITKMYNQGTSIDFGVLKKNRGYKFSTSLKYPGRVNMNQTNLAGVTFYCTKKYKLKLANSPSFHQFCIVPDFVRDLVKSMKFNYSEVELDGSTDLVKFEVDIAIESVIIKDGNHGFPKFIKYIPKTKLILFIKYPEVEKSADFYVHSFERDAWIAILITILLGGFFCIFIKYLENSFWKNQAKSDILEIFLTPYQSLCNQGGECDENIPFRICFLFFQILAILIVPAYCADLTAYLAVKIVEIPFKNIEEFAALGTYKLLAPEGQFEFRYFKERNDSLGQLLRDGLMENFDTINELKEKICGNDKVAFPFLTNDYLERFDCRLYQIPQAVQNVFPTLWMDYENHYHKILNHLFLQARESGLTPRIIQEKLSALAKNLQETEEEPFQSIELNQLLQIFYFLEIGLIIGFCIFGIESVFYFFANCKG